MRRLVLMVIAVTAAHAQWTMQESHTSAGLRGVDNVGGGVVWASGAQGTVLHTTDDGRTWQTCAVLQGAEKLDFRGIKGFDANTAIIMSSGTGVLSRLYKTSDACRTWRLVFTNPDESGFWDALQFSGPAFGVLIGDQVQGRFPVFFSTDAGDSWQPFDPKALSTVDKKQSFFAASNTALVIDDRNMDLYMITGGGTTSVITLHLRKSAGVICQDCLTVSYAHLDMAAGETAGGFSLASRFDGSKLVMVAVGGDYKEPERTVGTAAYLTAGRWHISETAPGGYRSAVAYYAIAKAWIAVGPNGSDMSMDDGRHWHALKNAEANWNALSLPFVVGPNGRIGKLDPKVFKP